MDNDDSVWPCTQAVVYNDDDDQPSDKKSNFGCLVLNNLANNKCYVLQEGDNTIGRHPSNNICIEHPSISMYHAVIQCDADGVVLLDKGSLNKTRLNKRNLKKDVAYFLDEDVLLMFGEVPVNYYVEGELVIGCNEISVQRMSKESNEVSGSKSLNKVNASLINENSSTSKMKTIVSKAEPNCTNFTLTDVHIEQNSSSPIDELLLEAISQIEANENNINSIKTENSKSRDSSSSPVMDLTGSVLLEPINNTLYVSNNDIVTRENQEIVADLHRFSNRVMPEKVQEDLCSPVMDLGSPLSDKILSSNKLPINVWQSPNKINTREDTPSPVMDLGLSNNSENKLSTLETYNPDVLSINKCTKEVEEFEETQMFDSPQKILISNSSVSKSQKRNETTFEQHDDIFCVAQRAESGEQSDQNLIDINGIQYLSGSPRLKPITSEIVPSKNNFCNKNKIYNDSFQNISTSKFHTTIKVDSCKPSTSKKNVNTFEADDDDIFSSFIQQESKSQTSNLISVNDEDFFNCPTQKISLSKKNNLDINDFSARHEEDTQTFTVPSNSNKTNTSTFSMCKDLIQLPEIEDDDFFNFPTQKVSFSKKNNSKISPTICKEETKFLPSNQLSTSTSTSCTIHIQNNTSQVPVIDNEDFFNCPTQKISVSNKINVITNRSLTTHKEESQQLFKLSQSDGLNTSKTCDTQAHVDVSQASKIDKDDFFNCPTQKISVPNKINLITNRSLTTHEDESQLSKLVQSDRSNTFKTCDTQVHKDITQTFEVDEEDFFNCPTQKILVSNKINVITNRSLTTHKEESQQLSKHPQSDRSNTSKTCDTQAHVDVTQASKIDKNDFFNCPTQKISVPNKINLITNRSLTTHKDESQTLSKLPQSDGSNTSKICDTQTHKDVTQTFKVDEEDFFNCPTQKISAYKNINLKVKMLSTTVHGEEPHTLNEFFHSNKTNTNTSKTCITDIHNEVTRVPEMNNEDFFNCPTQVLSTSKKINLSANVSSTSHEEDKQQLCKANSSISSLHQDLTCIPPMVDANFFDCPTQKISISKKINLNAKISSTTCKEETENLSIYQQPDKPNKNTSSIVVLGIDDKEFFNCPTQKLSISKEICSKVNVSSIVHEEETQKPSQELSQSNKIYTNISRMHKVLTRASKLDEEELFNCTTQKVLTSNNFKASSITRKEEAQLSLSNKPIIGGLKISDSTREHDDSTQIFETNNEDFFNCPTQKVLLPVKTKSSMNVKKQETNIVNINETETQDVSLQINETMSVSKNCLSGKNKRNIQNNLNCSTQILTTVSNESNKGKMIDDNDGEYKLTNKKKTIIPNDANNFKVRKSARLDFKSTSKLNIQPPITLSKNESLAKSPNIIKEPIIRVRNDLHSPCSVSKLKKKTSKLVHNISPMSTNININLPTCSKTLVDKENDLIGVSIKEEPLINDSIECQNVQHKRQLNLINETIFSPLNVPDESTNLLLEQCSSSKCVENNVELFNSNKLSTLSNDASKWQLFWNKKKMSSQNKEKGESLNNKVVGKTGRYQTRAITKRENTIDLSRKRKQDVSIDNSKRKLHKNDRKQDIFNTSTNYTSEVVVTFSYLRNRHLQEMKQFVEKTGGSVTDEITQCTVLVTDKIRCTMKILSAIARGCPIVDANWLRHSYTVNEFQDVNEFIIVDKDAERKYRFRLKESLARAQANRLLNGYNVLVTPSVKPGPKDMKVIITCAGGNYVVNWPKTRVSKELIVTCNQDRHQWKSIWDNSSAVVIDEDILVMSIIRQKLNI